jgi:hypothetical protein
LKLPLLLAEFLYQHKKLNLPGLGIFSLNPSIIIPDESERKENPFVPEVEFENVEINDVDDELIEFIKKNTGKIKPLAIADLESYITLAKQMINIGKPFYFDGIGTLSKGKQGKYDFVPGQHDVTGTQEHDPNKEKTKKQQKTFDEQYTSRHSQNTGGRKIALTLAMIAGVAIIAWGGYKLYEKNTSAESNEVAVSIPITDTTSTKIDTQQISKPGVDSSQIKKEIKQVVQPQQSKTRNDSLQFKFVILETNNKFKALRRYNQLLSYLLKIKMQTRDSSFFKLYFAFPATVKDTVHIKDSLNLVYATHTIIEPAVNN